MMHTSGQGTDAARLGTSGAAEPRPQPEHTGGTNKKACASWWTHGGRKLGALWE